MVHNDCYLGYDPKGLYEDRYLQMSAEDGDTTAQISVYAYSLSGVSMSALGDDLSSSISLSYQENIDKKTQIAMASLNQTNHQIFTIREFIYTLILLL